MIFSRVMHAVFISIRIIRTGRFMARIVSAISLIAGVSAAVAFTAGLPWPRLPPPASRRTRRHSLSAAWATRAWFPPCRHRVRKCHYGGRIQPHQVRRKRDCHPSRPAARDRTEVAIDATTAPTHVTGGPPVVALDFSGNPGLLFAVGSGGSQLLGVAVDDARSNGVTLDAGSITLNDNYIGLNLAGAAAQRRRRRVRIGRVGPEPHRLNGSSAPGVVANVISGNRGSGIVLVGSSANTVVDNRIGTNAAGTSAIANRGDGMRITQGSRGNEIGGTAFVDTVTGKANNPTGSKGTVTPVFVVPPLGNLISGNDGSGLTIETGSLDNALNGTSSGRPLAGTAPS